MLRASVSAVVPARVRAPIRQRMINPIMRRFDDWRFAKLVSVLRRERAANPGLIEKMRRAWGNEGFSAHPSYLREVAARVAQSDGPILECGTGLTTLVAGVVAEARGLSVVSLEQDRKWLARAQRALSRNGVRNVELHYAPLRRYQDYVWYDIGSIALPKRLGLVICDGPWVSTEETDPAAHANWRYGVLPVLRNSGIAVRELLLDDSSESRGPDVLQRWSSEFGVRPELLRAPDGDCALIRLSANFAAPGVVRPSINAVARVSLTARRGQR